MNPQEGINPTNNSEIQYPNNSPPHNMKCLQIYLRKSGGANEACIKYATENNIDIILPQDTNIFSNK